ncbi:MAG: Mce-associated rane protein [Actinomycetota bacterium]|jgi:hypothetical protein|nr:Mce-associated rane protein [Actinomycetota bacterium]
MSDTEDNEPGETRPVPDIGEPTVDAPGATDAAPGDDLALERARARRPFIVLCAGLLVVATFLGVLASRYHAELSNDRGERQQVQDVGARFATSFVTYDYRNLDASLQRIKADATTKFANEYERLFQTSVKTLITETQAQSKGTVTDVFLGPVQGQSATVLTVVNVERQGKAGRVPVAGTYLELDLVKSSGRWRVDNVTAINFTQSGGAAPASGAPAAPASTTTTVAK